MARRKAGVMVASTIRGPRLPQTLDAAFCRGALATWVHISWETEDAAYAGLSEWFWNQGDDEPLYRII